MKTNTYFWRGLDGQSHQVQGEIEATSLITVRHMLATSGIQITHCERLRPKPKLKPVTRAQVQSLTAQLASLLQSGIPLAQALDFAAQGAHQPALSGLLKRVQGRIEAGLSLHLALSQESCFDRSEIQLIRAGELSGNLELMLQRLSEHVQAKQALLRSLRSALNYPLVVGGVALAVVILVLTQVVPVFEEVFAQMGGTLPLATQWLIQLSRQLVEQGPIWISGLALLVCIWLMAWRHLGLLRAWVLRWSLALPLLGPLWWLTCQQRFAATLALMIQAGLPLTDGLVLAGEASGHPVFRRAGQTLQRRIQQGHALAESMRECRTTIGWQRKDIFPLLMIHMVSLGENSGQLDTMLHRWSVDAQERLRMRLTRMTDWLEPALIVFMGVVIGGLVIALYLPMFQMGQSF